MSLYPLKAFCKDQKNIDKKFSKNLLKIFLIFPVQLVAILFYSSSDNAICTIHVTR